MGITEKDFVELEYTGKLVEDNTIFDTTNEEIAKKAHLHNPQAKYGPMVICVGQRQLLPGLEEAIKGKSPGKLNVKLTAEKAFGKKDAKLIQLIPTKKFLESKIRPMPGLQVNVDGALGVVKMVSGGRTIVDFNHPLAGKDVAYEIDVKRKITDEKEQVEALVKSMLGDVKVSYTEGTATLTLKKKLPGEAEKAIEKHITELTKARKVAFSEEKSGGKA